MDYLRHNTNEFLGIPTKFRDINRIDERERRFDNREWFNRDFNRDWFNRDFNRMDRMMPWMNRDFNRMENMWNMRCEHNTFWRDCNRCRCEHDMFWRDCNRCIDRRCEHNMIWRDCDRCFDRFDFNRMMPWMNRMDNMNFDRFNRMSMMPWMNRMDNMWNNRCEHGLFWRDCNREHREMWNNRCEHNINWRDCNRCFNRHCEHNINWRECNRCRCEHDMYFRDCNHCDRHWDNRWFDNNMLCNTNYRPASEAEYHTIRNPIRCYDRDTRGLWLCFDLRGFRPEEVNCTFDRKERCINIEACHEVKDVKEHTIIRKFYRKFCLPEYMKSIDLSKMELRCFFGPDCFFYIEGMLPHMNFESWPKPCEMPFFGGWDWMRNWNCRDHRDNRECWDSNRCFRRITCKYI